MAIHKIIYRSLWMMALLMLMAGCSDPQSNREEPPPPLKEGTPLDVNATNILRSGSPYIVNSDWNIEAGRTVEIEAGTEIMFAGLYNVNVNGQLRAIGGADNYIKFTSAYLYPERGQWRSVKLLNPDPGQASVFEYCVFEYGAKFEDDTASEVSKYYRGMISIRNSHPVIKNCLVYHSQNNAIYIHRDSIGVAPQPTIQFNILTDNDGAAVRSNANVDMSLTNISYNCVGGNSIVPFLLGSADSTFGTIVHQNLNLDSTDVYYNLDREPEMVNPAIGNYSLTSCSPAVDAGPDGLIDPDGSRRDLGPAPYHQVGDELRGVKTGTLTAGATYRMSCHVRVPQDSVLTIPAGTRIEATGLYKIEVFGQLIVGEPQGGRVVICNCLVADQDVWGGIQFFDHDSLNPSEPSLIQYADIENYDQVDVDRAGVVFDHVRFTGGLQYGAAVRTGDISPEAAVNFSYCEFNNCGLYGLRVDSSAVTVRNSVVQNIKGRGISVDRAGTAMEITNTVVRACSTNGISISNLTSPRIVNCVITDNGYHGIDLINNCNPPILNTIIWANHRIGIKAEQSSAPQLSYNNVGGNPEANFQPSWLACANCISADPLFVNTTDFHLQAGSPCIDAGDPDPQYNDWNDGSRNDQGAYGGPAGQFIGPLGIQVAPNRVAIR